MNNFEEVAAAFFEATGYLAPGKDVPPEMGYGDATEKHRQELWKVFIAGRDSTLECPLDTDDSHQKALWDSIDEEGRRFVRGE